MPPEQVQRDDGRVELHRHGQRAERTLQADPEEGENRQFRCRTGKTAPGRHRVQQRQHGDQCTDTGGEVAVRHLDPRLRVRHRAGRRGLLGRIDVRRRAERAGMAVAAGPVRAAQP
jgi:hypothetical protein